MARAFPAGSTIAACYPSPGLATKVTDRGRDGAFQVDLPLPVGEVLRQSVAANSATTAMKGAIPAALQIVFCHDYLSQWA